MKIDTIKVTGMVEFINGEGDVFHKENLVVDGGKDWIAQRMADASTVMTHIAVGTNSAAAVGSQTTMGAELARKGMTVSGGTVTDNSIQYEVTFGVGEAVGALTEAGIFNNVSGGTMLARTVFPVYNKSNDDLFTIRWTITVS